MRKFLQKVAKASGNSNRCCEEFRDLLNRVYLFDDEPCESPSVFLNINHDALRKAIFLFGDIKIDEHFKAPTTLPYALENYGEEEYLHGLLGKKGLPFSDTLSMRRPRPLSDPDSLASCRSLTANLSDEEEKLTGTLAGSSWSTHSVSWQLKRRNDLYSWLDYIKNNAEMEPSIVSSRFILGEGGSNVLRAATETKIESDLRSLALSRYSFYNVRLRGEAGSADVDGAQTFPTEVQNLVKEKMTTEELQKLSVAGEAEERKDDENQEVPPPPPRQMTTAEVSDALKTIGQRLQWLEDSDCNAKRSWETTRGIRACLEPYKQLLYERSTCAKQKKARILLYYNEETL
ncbi:hypothetical protein TTRE_0000873701 [Trichuris trichiura]|uniref:Uncharacterized protein n=1 Tax=Trichuris trichiura TaxID=36087 RepID=A0A077ZNU2_TRITR|nr:hypothetical protein TTRE_0000873701 [Trichuris trichiura]